MGQPPRDHVLVRTTSSETAASARIGAKTAKRERDELLGLLRPCFGRVEVFAQARKYLGAVMSDIPERNGWSIARFAGDATPDKTQRLLNHEEEFEFGKGQFGLDQSQVRLFHAIARHTVLACAALAICAVTAALLHDRTDTQAAPPVRPDQRPPAEPGLIPLTVPQVRRLLAAETVPSWPPGHVAHWDWWTRRHQARARWFHKRTRLGRDATISLVS
jgi:hypothetical protein